MATGHIRVSDAEETITLNLDSSKVSVKPWGSATAKRVGNIVYIRFYGVTPKTAMSNATVIGSFSGTPSKVSVLSPLMTENGVEGRAGVDTNSNNIFFGGVTNLGDRYTSLIIPV